MISFLDVGKVLKEISELTDFVIIGDTVVDLLLKRKGTESDVDIFPLELSAVAEEDKIRNFSENNGWDYGTTPIDTPRLLVPLGDSQLQVDIYDNIQDFFVPEEILKSAIAMSIGDSEFKVIRLEDYILLKANAYREEDEDELKTILHFIGEKKLKIDKNYLYKHTELFEENSENIKERLELIGFKLS
ncbi:MULTISPECIES: nucleotidyltransferase [Acidianus]|uniref:Nucleotidyltransferase n=1 Tax=Candidatus Acidianus copahuensis TaxID=1160895 RepID=A0A031LM80_9CREN|nr:MULTISPECIES: nucleotidyltransferase [Acidianus]EZQ03786.1 nucleotidyltransferase [Candidatus Acidianus copahuensis]NON62706.1 nucleotidyltransferase [Acidianus sp. RZ1]